MIRIGLVGAGTMGKAHNAAYKDVAGAVVRAVCDMDTEKAAALARDWDAPVYGSMKDMLESGGIDAVDICLPTPYHREAVELAAAHGKHVLCEKPIAGSLEDAKAMIEACKRAEVTFMVGHVVRFNKEFQMVRQKALSGVLGEPGVIRTVRSGSFPPSIWYNFPEQSGGPLLDLAIHDFDFLRWCFGPVDRVFSRQVSRDRFYHTLTILRFANGAMAHVEASWAYPKGSSFQVSLEIAGTKGLIRAERQKSHSITVYSAEGGSTESPVSRSFYAEELEHFAACVQTGATPLITGEEALETLRIGLAAIQSAQTGQMVEMEGFPR